MDTSSSLLTSTLDKIEAKLPAVPRGLFKLNRTVTAAWYRALWSSTEAIWGVTRTVTDRAGVGAKTVRGQAGSVAKRVEATVTSGVKEVAGQAKAQTSATLDVLEEETIDLLEAAVDAVDSSPGGAYETRSKSELYERAQELGIDGRSSMSKAELITALRSVQ